MQKISTKKLVFGGLMTALVFLVTFLPFLRIPSPIKGGYFNIGDSIIMIAAILLGRNYGFAAGAFGSALADIAVGGVVFAPITFVVKGIEGFVVGLIARKKGVIKSSPWLLVATITGAAIMVAGYFIGETTILKLLDPTFGLTAAVTELPGNSIQGIASVVIGYGLTMILIKSGVSKTIDR